MTQAEGDLTTVYQYFAGNGALVYVGITNRGSRRLHEHADSKPWWHLATGCTLEHYLSRAEALAREAYLIRTYRPPFNDQHNPDRRPIEERTENLRTATAVVGHDQRSSLKERRAAWYAVPKERRKSLPCVRCGQRPGVNGPECLVCRQLKTSSPAWQAKDDEDAVAAIQRLLDIEKSRPLLASEKRSLRRLRNQMSTPNPTRRAPFSVGETTRLDPPALTSGAQINNHHRGVS